MFYWDGTGAVDFQPISTAQPGVAFVAASPATRWPPPMPTAHSTSTPPGSLTWLDGGPVPADGVYLLSPTASVVGLTDSNPFFMLFLVDHNITNEDDASALKDGLDSGETMFNGKDYTYFNNARDYVQNNLAVPEPTTLALIGQRVRPVCHRAAGNASLR